jgi:hypothetical protein
MSWVNDLASVLGLPVGAATVAVAMYAACTADERASRPEALKDIGRILKDPSWSRSARPTADGAALGGSAIQEAAEGFRRLNATNEPFALHKALVALHDGNGIGTTLASDAEAA